MSVDKPAAADAGVLRILSCNILAGASVRRYSEYFTRSWGAILPGKYKLGNLDHLASSIAGFDIVGLQEADAGSIRSGFLNQTRYLAETAGMPYWCHQPNRKVSSVSHTANGLISRAEPDEVLDYALPGRLHGRGVLLARYGDDADALTIAIAHLSLGSQSRMRQLGFIGDLLKGCRNAVLMGDLNCPPDSPELRELFAHTTLAPAEHPAPTFPSWHPNRAIDHILVTPAIQVQRMWTLPQAFSDHLPLAAEIRVPMAASAPIRHAA